MKYKLLILGILMTNTIGSVIAQNVTIKHQSKSYDFNCTKKTGSLSDLSCKIAGKNSVMQFLTFDNAIKTSLATGVNSNNLCTKTTTKQDITIGILRKSFTVKNCKPVLATP